jgi:hypothetical protein
MQGRHSIAEYAWQERRKSMETLWIVGAVVENQTRFLSIYEYMLPLYQDA